VPPHEPDASVGHGFGLELDDGTVHVIREFSGLIMEQEVLEFFDGGEPASPARKVPGRRRGGEVTVTRDLTDDTRFETWVKDVRSGAGPFRTTPAVIVLDGSGGVIKRYRLVNAWPRKLEIGTLRRADVTELVEKLTITYEELAPE